MLAIAAGAVPVLVLVLGSGVVPFNGPGIIPIAGIVIGNTMTAATLTGRRAYDEIRGSFGSYEAGLALGLTSPAAAYEVVQPTAKEALTPGLDQTRTVGLVTLPGAFIGVLLGGGTPLEAGAAQILVLIGLMAGQALTCRRTVRLVASGRVVRVTWPTLPPLTAGGDRCACPASPPPWRRSRCWPPAAAPAAPDGGARRPDLPGAPRSRRTRGSGIAYVALGDSLRPGPLCRPPTWPSGCLRSDHNYPSLLATRLDVDGFIDVSCAARPPATCPAGSDLGDARVPPQLRALDRGTDLVTLGIGGNDLDLFATLVEHLHPAAARTPPVPVRRAPPNGPDLVAATRTIGAQRRARAAGVRRRAPKARVVLVGYLRLAPRHGACPDCCPSPPATTPWAAGSARCSTGRCSRPRVAPGSDYVDMYDASRGPRRLRGGPLGQRRGHRPAAGAGLPPVRVRHARRRRPGGGRGRPGLTGITAPGGDRLARMSALAGLVERGLVAPDWAEALAPVDEPDRRDGRSSCAPRWRPGAAYLPAGDRIFRAFQPAAGRRAGAARRAGPLPDPGHPIGLSFAVDGGRRAAAAQPGQHLPGAAHRPRLSSRPRTAT